MKKIISMLLSCSMLFSCASFPSVTANATDVSMTAQEIVDDITVGWNLGDDLDCYNAAVSDDIYDYEMYWGNPVATREMIQAVHAAGFNAIRIPVTWEQKLDENDHVKDFWMDRVQEVVDYAYDDGMYVLLNVHHDTSWGWLAASESSWNAYQGRFASLWEQIAERFANYDNHLMFEGFNEILNDEGDWGFWDNEALVRRDDAITYTNKWNQLFVDTVRSGSGYNPQRVLVCNTYAASCEENVLNGLVRFELPEDTVDDCLITSVHFYQPYLFAGDPNDNSMDGFTDKYDAGVRKDMMAYFDTIAANLSGPVLIGEWGAYNKGNTADRVEYCSDFVSAAEQSGYTSFLWDAGVQNSDFGYLYRYEGTWWYPDIIEAIMDAAGIADYSIPPCKDYSGNSNLAADPFRYTSWCAADANARVTQNTDSETTLLVKDSGTKPHGVLLSYKPVGVQAGKTYHISFEIASDRPIEFNDAAMQMGYLKSDYSADVIDYEEPLTITDKMQHYEFDYTSSWDYDATVYFWVQGGEHDSYSVTVSALTIELKETQEPDTIAGDINADDEFNVADVVLLQKWLLAVPDTHLADWKAADFYEDNRLDVFDLCLMKRALLARNMTSWEVVDMGITEYRFISDTSIDVTVTETGEDTWWAQVYLPVALEAGATYEVQYTIRADANHTFNACIQKNSGDYNTYYYNEMTASTKAKTVKETFTAEEDCPDAKFGFNLGYEPGTYRISNVKIVKVQ